MRSRPTSAASRTGLDAPSTSWSPGRSASATAAATCRPVVSGWALSCARTASIAWRLSSAQRRNQAGFGSPAATARVPVACELPDTSGQRGPVVSAYTGTAGSASSADTGRCRVGRPSMITCCGRSSGSANGCSGLAAAGAVGSATVGNAARFGCSPAPWPAMTTVSRLRSMSSGWSKRDRRGVGPRLAVRAARAGSGPGSRVGDQRLAQRDVELHRPRVGAAGTGSGRQYSAGGRSPRGVERVHPLRRVLGQPEADRGADLGAEVAQLLHGLVGAGAEQLVGPVGRQHDQRHPRVVGLHHRRAQVGHRGARRHRHAHRRAGGDRPARSPGYPAVRSSMRTCSRIRPARSASCSANANGALREPGHSTTSRTPPRISSSTTTRACAVEGLTPATACYGPGGDIQRRQRPCSTPAKNSSDRGVDHLRPLDEPEMPGVGVSAGSGRWVWRRPLPGPGMAASPRRRRNRSPAPAQ